MKPTQISKILKLCRQNHVKSIKIDGIEVEFHLAPATVTGEKEDEQPQFQGSPTQPQPSSSIPKLRSLAEDEMLFWSTPSFDQIIEERKKDQTA